MLVPSLLKKCRDRESQQRGGRVGTVMRICLDFYLTLGQESQIAIKEAESVVAKLSRIKLWGGDSVKKTSIDTGSGSVQVGYPDPLSRALVLILL